MCLGSATSARKLSHYQARCCRWVVILLAVLGFMVPGHAQTADAFNPGLQGFLGANTLAIQPDGGILAGGNLWAIAGQAQYFLGRINGDGTADRTFSPFDKYGSNVTCIQVMLDGKILVGGNFKRVCGQNRSSIARLQPDGNLDTPFHAGADAPVNVLAVQTDGKILVGGTFATLDDQPRPYLGRLEPDGTLDTHFEPVLDGSIGTMVLQPDGAIVLGGSFSNVNGQPANGLCRLNPDGSLDTSFLGTVNGPVWTVALQPDGKILVGGSFTDLAGQSQTNLGRLNPDGSLDGSFTSVYNRMVTSIALQADGRMIVSGQASSGTMWVTNIARLEPDGRLDPSFEAGAVGSITALALQEDGKLVIAGTSFTRLEGQSRTNIGRLNNTYAPVQSLTSDGASITWLWGGTSPEVSRAIFEISSDGTKWTGVGEGRRVADGWQVTGLSLPPDVRFRVRGMVVGGYLNRCSWPVEMTGGPPWIITQPPSLVVSNGEHATFTVLAAGSPALAYQWRWNEMDLPGMTQSSLVLSNISAANTGNYDVVVSNAFGVVVSSSGSLALLSSTSVDSFAPSIETYAETIAIQPDGRVLIGGGGPSPGYLKRFFPDGSADPAFSFSANNAVTTVAIQEDLKILVGGGFTVFNGQSCASLCRLNPNGTLDSSFSAGIDGQVNCQAIQADGRILIGGSFTTVGGQPHTNLARLNTDGSVDASYGAGASATVHCLALQEDNALLVGGSFRTLNDQSRNGLGRLLPDGTLDETFDPGGGVIWALAVQGDGRIVACGTFSMLGGQSRPGIGRLNYDGTVDTTFYPGRGGNLTAAFSTLAVQRDGRIIVGGTFKYSVPVPGGASVYSLGRLNRDGAFDLTFKPLIAGNSVDSLALQPDGKVIASGMFSGLGGQARPYIGRVNNTASASQNLGLSPTTATWLRSGTGPDLCRATFDASVNGVDWTSLGQATRVPGGWAAGAAAVPAGATIRARGFVTVQGNSGWFCEDYLFQRAPAILTGDGNFGVRGGQFGFNMTGTPGQTAILEASTNLTSWTPVSTNRFGEAPLYFGDPAWTNLPVQFYRLRSP